MKKSPTKIDFIPSSTPINPHHDSGYIGSERKTVVKKLFHALSPIKEDSLRAKKIRPDSDSGIFSPSSIKHLFAFSLNKLRKIRNDYGVDHSSPDVVRKLNFNESSDLSNEIFCNEEKKNDKEKIFEEKEHGKEKVVTRFPLSQMKGVKLEMFDDVQRIPFEITKEKSAIKKKVDIFNELKVRNCQEIVSSIISYLPDEDLNSVYAVSKAWKKMLVEDEVASLRRKTFLENQMMTKENQYESRLSGINDRYDRSTVVQKYVLDDITNITPVLKNWRSLSSLDTAPQNLTNQPVLKKELIKCAKFESFLREGKNLQNGLLMKCPKCSFAAKNHNGNEYICTECEYVFCKNCLCPILKFHTCGNFEIPVATIIGSKKSKRNLRRL